MGRVRTKTIKRGAKLLIEKYYHKLTHDFHTNKRILSDVGRIPSKKLRNKIAGFATQLMKRIQKGPVKGISLKIQQEERQRRLEWVPKKSQIDITNIQIDKDTKIMLDKIEMGNISNITIKAQEKQDRNKADKKARIKGVKKPKKIKEKDTKIEEEKEKVEAKQTPIAKQQKKPKQIRQAKEPKVKQKEKQTQKQKQMQEDEGFGRDRGRKKRDKAKQ